MSVSLLDIDNFKQLFSGDLDNYGVFTPDGTRTPEGKVGGKSYMVHQRITDEVFVAHLEGRQSIGMCPIRDSTIAVFSVIDVDEYSTKAAELVPFIYSLDMPIVPFRSKSGGLHLYAFFSDGPDAEDAIALMHNFRGILGLPSNVEIFPKQKKLGDRNYGSWINLPYFGNGTTDRYVFGPRMQALPLMEGLEYAKSRVAPLATMKKYLDDLPLSDAPPCLQSIYMRKHTDSRNKYLFGFGVYAKSKYGEAFDIKVGEANAALKTPLHTDELEDTCIKSLRKKDYTYTCKEAPLCDWCRKDECKRRPFGVGSDNVTQLSYEQLVQYVSDPPYYKWTINGKEMLFSSESELISQQRFRELAIRVLHVFPQKITEARWTAILQTALSNMVTDKDNVSVELSDGGALLSAIGEFILQKAAARTREQVLMGKVYRDTDHEVFIFKGEALIDFLMTQKNLKNLNKADLQEKLKQMGGNPVRTFINSANRGCRVWTVPIGSVIGTMDDLSDVEPEVFLKEDTEGGDEY